MATLPTPIRAALGLAATAIDEARRLPETLPQLSVAAISTAMQTSLRVQQHIAEYAARGDELLSALRGSSDEPPAWATFDDDASAANGTSKAAFELIDDADALAEEEPADLIAPATAEATGPGGADPSEPASAAVAAPARKAAAKKAAPAKSAAKKAPGGSPAKKAAPTTTAATKAPTKKAPAKKAPAKATRSEPLEVAAERADPDGPPNPSVLAAEIVQAHQNETE